ncbi:Vacuolar protein sorting-associated protein 13 [Paramarasmius palmivorus]|uniref:Vacuolar protein sorting-associated protein 13 n=1 Tax=Paramarasmius palmivorus TaxID=297713 RepID=A0AAW0E4V6_9AGAR
MWWLDPGKEVLNVVFNRILAPYVENLDMNQVNYGIGQGQLTLRKLRLKRGALDKFRLPVDVLEGHLGKFTLSLHWMNLGNQPVEILIEDVSLLVVPSTQNKYDPAEEENRALAAKLERVENAELLHMRGQPEKSAGELCASGLLTPLDNTLPDDESPQQQGLMASLIAKIINNLQVTIKNIHIRYEDKLSVPGHPFAVGVTLASFAAVSVDDNWQPAFIESTAGAIHKLGKLESLAVYFDTDSPSISGLPPVESAKKFNDMISKDPNDSSHQFILKPVSGEGRITLNNKVDKKIPRFDIQLFFDEIGVALDDSQYHGAISLLDMYHVYIRRHQYRKYQPSDQEYSINRARARLRFAATAILEGVRERHRRWTWEYFAERRDDRLRYVELFQKKTLATLTGQDLKDFENLEKKLSYEDIRFYRSIARSRLRKDRALRKRLEEEKAKQQPQRQGWGSWLWGSSSSESSDEDTTFGNMTEEQRKELYDVLDYDEKNAVADSFQTPRDSMKARIVANLNRGSFALKTEPHNHVKDIISVNFDSFQANVIQRPDNLEAALSLGGFSVFDGTTPHSVHPQIVRVKDINTVAYDADQPFLFIKFENSPLDERADNALTVRMRHMEIIYHKGYVEAVYKFFKPPESQLESVEALLSVASQTLEGLSKETRAGLEFALQNHKTIDIQMDMNAPIIIVPEDVTTNSCKHLIVDAGHISIESELADKDAIRSLRLKKDQTFSPDDDNRLQSLMYDKLSLKLEAAQFIIGNDLQSCLDALSANSGDSLHLLERINIDLSVQNSIVPTYTQLAKFKVSGKLPSLQVNLSDTKYKALMRLIDVSIPHFDDEQGSKAPPRPVTRPAKSGDFLPLPYVQSVEYHTDDGEDDDPENPTSKQEQQHNHDEAPDMHQHIFELAFQVDRLGATLSKSAPDGTEKPLGNVSFNRFDLFFVLAKFDMKVDVNLRSLSMDLHQPNKQPMKFISSSETVDDKDLLSVTYFRVQKDSPEYSGVDQAVDVKISTFKFYAAPEPVVSLYDFIMTTFVPQPNSSGAQPQQKALPDIETDSPSSQDNSSDSQIKVNVELASVQIHLVNEDTRLATLMLSTARVAVIVFPRSLKVNARLGSLSLSNDSKVHSVRDEFNQILSIEGENFADFDYQTFNPDDPNYNGIKTAVGLRVQSIKLHYVERALRDIYLFLAKLAKLKGLYDAATQAAVQTASEVDIDRLHFNVFIDSPILVFPSDPAGSRDIMTMRLGAIKAENSFEGVANKIDASLSGVQLTSTFHRNGEPSILKIIEDIDVKAHAIQTGNRDRSVNAEYPDTQVSVNISPVKLQLTQTQYILLMAVLQSVPRVLEGAPAGTAQAEMSASSSDGPVDGRVIDALPTEPAVGQPWTTVDLVVVVETVKLSLYDASAVQKADLRHHGIAEVEVNHTNLRFKMLSNGAQEAQVVLKSFVMTNTRPGNTRFREIIPAARHDRNQFMVLYTSGPDGSAQAILSIDTPQIIFSIDPVFGLLHFFTDGIATPVAKSEDQHPAVMGETGTQKSNFDFRVDLHDISICVLENDSDPNSQSIQLTVQQVLMSQQGVMALTVNRLGMSLVRMGKSDDTARFLDDFDLTFALDSRASSSQNMTSIELNAKPIVFRASYRDIKLITTIVNKAIELYTNSQSQSEMSDSKQDRSAPSVTHASPVNSGRARSTQPSGKARVVTSREELKASFDGFRLVLIGDMHEQPMLHLKVKPFIVGAKDWSGELSATTTLATQISYWNLTNSHWEPLIDPWTFSILVARETPLSELNLKLSARERLDLNLSTTFAELAITTLNTWNKEGDVILQNARGSYAPYRIHNRTGSPILVWTEDEEDHVAHSGVQIANEQTIDWRFDDWRTMREHVATSGHHNINLQCVGKSWEQINGIPVDKEGEFVFPLRPRTEKHSNRLLCEVKVVDNVKVVTIRSTYKVENLTLYPLEITLVDEHGHPVYSMEKLAPGRDYSLPIEAVSQNRIRIQPDQGFGYKWCGAIRWEDLVAKRSFTIKCPHTDPREAAFRFQAWVQSDLNLNDSLLRKYPKINLKLRAPIELENLLPYNLQYRVYDKDTDQNWKSYLRQGGIMPVHSVELGHLVLLNVQVQDTVFKPSDFAIINTDGNSEFDIESRLVLRDPSDRKLHLKLNYVRYPDSGGAFKVQIYSPYVVVNKTGLPFCVRTRSNRAAMLQDVAGDTRADILSSPTPFLLSHTNDRGHEFLFKFADSSWSKPCSLEAPAAETALVVSSPKQRGEEIHIGLSWSEGLGKYKLSKVITLAPRFLIKNNLSEPIAFRQHGVALRERSVIHPGERVPLQFLRQSEETLLTIAFPGLNAQWSPPINIGDIGPVHLRLPRPGNDTGNFTLVRADIKLDGSTVFVHLAPALDEWPFVIENNSDYTFILCQKDATARDEQMGGQKSYPSYKINAHSTFSYAWDFPAAKDKKLLLTYNSYKRVVDVMEIGALVPFKFNEGRTVSLDVRADGTKQILRITNYNAQQSLYKPRARSSSGTLSRQDTVSSSVEAFEAVTEEIPPTFGFKVDFAGIGVSLVNKKLVEVIYLSMDKLLLEYTISPTARAFNLSCGSLQVDNQLHDALFPVILQPTPVPKESNTVAALPTVQASVILLNDEALTIEADEDFLFAVYDLTQIKGASWEEGTKDILIETTEIPEPKDTASGQDIYFEVLELQPIKLSLSFMRTERVSSEEKLSIRNPLAVVVNALTMAVGNINDAPLELNALAIKDVRLTTTELQNRIFYHYRQDVLRQLYRILGSADFIGNPVGLFTNVSSGVADIFYEPFNGVVMHGNRELGIGIAKGAASFVKKTVFGLSDSMTKFTSSVGKGLSAATFDSEYQARRRMTQRRNRPRHAMYASKDIFDIFNALISLQNRYGVTAGGEALASSVASAMEGVVMKPIEGAESEGALGFFKGMGKGLVGAVTKPVVGVFDLASNVSEGIRNTTTVFDSPERDRVRMPRLIPHDNVLRPYAAREALGQYWMRDLNNGAYRKEHYVAHISQSHLPSSKTLSHPYQDTPGSDNVVLLTMTRVLSFWSKRLRLDWELPLTQIQGVTVEDTGIRFAHKAGKEHDKFVFIPDKSSQSWFFEKVASVVKAFNIRRRMDA